MKKTDKDKVVKELKFMQGELLKRQWYSQKQVDEFIDMAVKRIILILKEIK